MEQAASRGCTVILTQSVSLSSKKLSFAKLPISLNGLFVCLFVCFVALHPKSTAMVMAGRSVHLITLFPGQA